MRRTAPVNIFSTVAEDYIGIRDDLKAGNEFLRFKKRDVANAIGEPLSSIRYDRRTSHEVKCRMLEIANVINLVAGYFKGDLEKTKLWFETDNHLLGDIAPRDMIRYGRYAKLRKFILNALEGNAP